MQLLQSRPLPTAPSLLAQPLLLLMCRVQQVLRGGALRLPRLRQPALHVSARHVASFSQFLLLTSSRPSLLTRPYLAWRWRPAALSPRQDGAKTERAPPAAPHGRRSETKFNSGCGWPAFYDHIPGSVERHEDNTFGMRRVEITCAQARGEGRAGSMQRAAAWQRGVGVAASGAASAAL